MRALVLATIIALAAPFAAAQTAQPAAPAVAGKVEFADGDVRFYDRAQQARRPKAGDTIAEGESIVTGAGGEVHLDMEDGGFIAVRPNTRMRIVNYRAQGDADDRSLINLIEGSLRSMTGWIGRIAPRNYAIQTPTATIGVRGTDHEPLVIPEGSALGEPGTYDRVNAGGTTISGQRGRIDVTPGRAGFFPQRGTAPPRLLASVPQFFRPTAHEARFAGRYQAQQRGLEQRRAERIKVVEQQRRPDAKADKGRDEKQRKLDERKAKDGDRRSEKAPPRQAEDRRQAQEQRREEALKQRERQQELQQQRIREREAKKGDPGARPRDPGAREARPPGAGKGPAGGDRHGAGQK